MHSKVAGEGRLKGKVCIITGTGGSIGRATALAFAREGARVVGCDVFADAAEETVELVEALGGEMTSVQPCDLTNTGECEKLVNCALRTYGQLDVLFNNAAMAWFSPITDISDEEWCRTIDHELNLVFRLTRAAWGELTRRSGSIINMGSCSAWQTFAALPALAHSAAKGAVVSLTRQLALEGRTFNLRANSISPGLIETKQTRERLSDPQWSNAMIGKIMLGRMGRPDEVAATALFLASNESSFITGTDIRVDGGTTAW